MTLPQAITMKRKMFKPQNWLDRVFEIGIIGKGLNGAAELIGGTLVAVFNAGPDPPRLVGPHLKASSPRTRTTSSPPTCSTPAMA